MRKIAEWLDDPDAPDDTSFALLDSLAVTLLPVLAERGYLLALIYGPTGWAFAILMNQQMLVEKYNLPTIAQAITAAVLSLPAKETP